ncbi:MAG: hypothetical protein COT84_00805 [Chlamydiae bacterium CG10_big_fil_rev_8_21_14_0_10_35_9]|nr:MAG: hypothetical protein COT84_00805 [Chlamydiae bacterium CG10_big_fil_rev_8_21_14_0_10_35_9]
MKKLLLLFILFQSHLFSDTSPFIPESGQESVSIPNPADLSSNWWSFFDVKGDAFDKRAEKALAYFAQMQEKLPSASYQKSTYLMDKVQIAVNTLSNLKKATPPIPPSKPAFQNTYNLASFIALGNTQKDLSEKIDALHTKVNLESSKIKSEDIYLDTLKAEYMDLDPSDTRYLLGLEIIATRMNISSDQIRLKIQQASLENLKIEEEFLEEEIAHARKVLVVSKEDLTGINSALYAQESHSEAAQQEVLLIQSRMSTHRDRVTEQQLLNAFVQQNLEKIRLIDLQIQKNIVLLGLNSEDISLSTLYQQIDVWRMDIEKIQNEQTIRRKTARVELENTLEELSQTSVDTEMYQHILTMNETALVQLQKIEQELYLSEFLLDQLKLLISEHYATFKDKIAQGWHSTIGFFKENASWFEKRLFKIGETSITPFALIKFLITIIIIYLVSWLTRKGIIRLGSKHKKLNQAGIYTLSRLFFYIMMTVGVIIAFTTIGIDFTAFAYIAGALSVGIGFGLQSFFNNFIAGIIVLLEKNVRIGDFIGLESGELGTVKEIKVRTTLIKTLDNLEILIPNSELVMKKFTNWTLSEKIRRIRVPFGVAYGTDKEKVSKIIIEAAKKVPLTIEEKEPQVWLVKFGESSLDFELVVWVNEYTTGTRTRSTTAKYLWTIETALKENNIVIPYPTRDVHLYQKNEPSQLK